MSDRVKGATSVSLFFRLVDATTGAPKTGVDVTTLKLQYARPGVATSTATALTLLGAATASFTAYGAFEMNATDSKGVYRVDCPDAAFLTGADEVVLTVAGTAIQPSSRLIDLTGINTRDAARAGLTALPATGTLAVAPVVTLAANAFDSIAVTDPGAPSAHTTIPKMLVALWRRAYKQVDLVKLSPTTGAIHTYADDGTTIHSTQPVSDDGTTQTQAAAT